MKAYCSLRVCDMCREKVKIQVLAPWTDSKGNKRNSLNEIYCVAELFDGLRGTELFHTKNVQIQWADQRVAQLFGGENEEPNNAANDKKNGGGVQAEQGVRNVTDGVHSLSPQPINTDPAEEVCGETYRG